MRKPKVFIVDDKPANHLALAAVLEEDHELRFANSGPEAIEMLERSPDVDGRVCQSTDTAQRILRADPSDDDAYGELLGWRDSSGQMIKNENGPLARALRSGETTHSEPLSIRCLDGTRKTILASVSPLHGLERRIVGAVILIRDVTEAKKIEEDLAQRVTKLIGLSVELEESAAQ